MARKIIIQNRINEPSDFSFRFVMWADVPAARQPFYADQTKGSSVKDVTAQELQDIKDGKILERSETAEFIAGTSAAAIRSYLISQFNQFQTEANSRNPWQFYGTFWDGSTWTNAGVS